MLLLLGKVIIGILSGIVSGTGMGGGTILIFLLTFFYGIDQHVAQAINMIFFIPTSIVAIIVNVKNKNIDFKLAILVTLLGILGSIIGANFAVKTNVENLRKYFGIFLLIIAIHEIYTIIKNKKTERINKKRKGLIIMKFAKGLLVGGLITTGLIMMYNDTNMMNKNKMMKKGKQFVKKMGIM